MKTNNSTLHSIGFSFKRGFKIPTLIHFIGLVTTVFYMISFVSFAGEVTGAESRFVFNKDHSKVLMPAFSPLTGTESLRTNLYLLNANNTTKLADGVLTEYNNLYHDSVYLEDAYKFTNINENLGLIRYGSVLSVERRPIIFATDTLFLKLWKTTRREYQFEFITVNLDHPGMQAFLEDAYLGTSTSLVLSGTTKINFSVNTDVASANVNRFKIVYRTNFVPSTLPVTITAVTGYQQGKKIVIDWKVQNELNVEKYELEHSANGFDFNKINSIAAGGTNISHGSYSLIDDNPANGSNFYRVKTVDRDGSKKYSLIVKVTTNKKEYGSVNIYPNPIRGNMINLRFTNQPPGIYQVKLINNSGQVLYCGNLPVNTGNISLALNINKKLPPGIHQLEIKGPGNTIHIKNALVQE